MVPADQDSSPEPESLPADTDVAVDEPVQPLKLDVTVEQKSACERHVIVMIAREDVDRYFSKQYDELMPRAELPGFRPGRAPRKLVESKFRAQIKDQVKGALLLDCMNQINEEQEFSAISEPDFDFDAIEIPEDGPMRFEFDIEVRPEFELPNWKGLEIERPARGISDEDVDKHLILVLEDYADVVPVERPIELNDHVTLNITVKLDGKVVNEINDVEANVRPTFSFPDSTLKGIDKLLVGASVGETRSTTAKIVADAENAELREKDVEVEFEILDVKVEELPEFNDEMLEKLGFETVDDVRKAVREELTRQLEYRQSQAVRTQITNLLTESADWDLPKELLKRQSNREIERAIMELRASGFDDSIIRNIHNELRQNTMERTKKALKEHFILESIAEAEKVEDTAEDFDHEIKLIADQLDDSPRRVRARLEKRGQMDSLRNQIIERKVIELIKSEAKFKEAPFEFGDRKDSEAIMHALSGEAADIPEAKHDDSSPENKTPEKLER
jgi:trigger factor